MVNSNSFYVASYSLLLPNLIVACFLANIMLITITSPVGIFNVSDVKPEFKSIDNFYFETLSNDSISDPIRFGIRNVENFKTKFWNKHNNKND